MTLSSILKTLTTTCFIECFYFSKKKVKPSNFLQNYEQATGESKADANQIPMYCKDLIYGGVTELSFEELRAAMYEAKKKEEVKEQGDLFTHSIRHRSHEISMFVSKKIPNNSVML